MNLSVPVNVIDVLWMSLVVFNKFVDEPRHESWRDPLASVNTFI